MKHRVISSILALTALLSLFTGCEQTEMTDRAVNTSVYSIETVSTAAISTNVENLVENVETSLSATTFTTITTADETSEPVFSDDMAMSDSKKSSAPATISNLNNETFLKYTNIKNEYKPVSTKNVYLYNFNTSLSAGFGEDDIAVPTEANYGVTGKINGRKINAAVYNHTGKNSVKAVYIESLDASVDMYNKISLTNNKLQLDTTNYSNGLYRILIDFSNKKSAKLNFYINGNTTLFCQLEILNDKTAKIYEERRTALAKILKDGKVTPQNSLSLEGVCYPFKEFNNSWRCDTQRWIDLSNEIVDDNWSDEYKLFKMMAWIRDNIAYDNYVAHTLDKSRAQYNMDFSGKYSVYNSKAGVCHDYANIIAIMCRAHNIPAITIGSKNANHMWNVVYINNRWIEIDGTRCNKYKIDKDIATRKDTNNNAYDGIYKIIPNNNDNMTTDTIANHQFQQNSNKVY